MSTGFSIDLYHSLDDGKRMRYQLFEPKGTPRGTVLIAPGRREFIEKKVAELGSEFLERGFRLIIFDWRGQGLSDRVLSGDQYQRDHIQDFDIYLNDFRSFYEKVVKLYRTGSLLVTGHSMGGHILARWLAEYSPSDVKAAILTSPMLALASPTAHSITHAFGWLESSLGRGESYVTGQHDYNEQDCLFANNPLTHDPERFALMERYFTTHPAMTVGGVTWDWLNASLRSMKRVQSDGYLERIQQPVLTLMGGSDHVTPATELTHYLQQIPHAENHIIPHALHDLMNEAAPYRTEAWKHIDRFLGRVNLA